MTRLEVLNQAAGGEATIIKQGRTKLIIDQTTASAMLAVYNALNEANRNRFMALSWTQAVEVTWRIIKKARA